MTYKKILVAIDNSEQGQIVFTKAIEIAKKQNAKLFLLNCLPFEESQEMYSNIYGQDLPYFSESISESITQEIEATKEWLRQYSHQATEEGVAIEWDFKCGQPSSWITEISKTWQADLIVIGRRGRQGLSEMFLGSVSNYVVHHVHCSVLVVQGVNS